MSSESFSSDQQTTVGALRAAVDQFVTERDWYQYHSPKNLAMSIAIEAAEIMEHFQWLTTQEATMLMGNAERRAEVADELADVLIYCLSFANAIGQKLARNQLRFPIERVHGRLGNE
jgi:NTP pyrophosphatase (non-canonical NTP hydrolase)